MSGMDNWLQLSRWWHEHFVLNERQRVFRSITNPQLGNVQKCVVHADRTLTRENPSRRRHIGKSPTLCEPVQPDDGRCRPMTNSRANQSRQFSIGEGTPTKDEQRQPSPNLLQKLLFRQFSPKTRPYSNNVQTDETSSCTPARRVTPSTAKKSSWASSSSSSNNSKQSVVIDDDSSPLKTSQPVDLNAYLSKRRNTTGSISLTKIVDLKNTAAHSSSNQKIFAESLFQTIEESDLLATKQLIETNETLVNSSNEFDWYPLDVAMMLNNIPIIRLLVAHGAEESPTIQPEEIRYRSVCHQLALLMELNGKSVASSNRLNPDDIQWRRSSPIPEKQQRRSSKTPPQDDCHQQRILTLLQMKDNYQQAALIVKSALRFLVRSDGRKSPDFSFQRRIPDLPTNVRLMVTGPDHLTVSYDEPLRSQGAMVVKYKIEWSNDEQFTDCSSEIVKNCFLREYVIRNLPMGEKCYVRVSAGNIKGFGPAALASPAYCVPSNWREFSKTSRSNLTDLPFEEILNRIFNDREGYSMQRALEGSDSPELNALKNRRRSYGNLRRNLRQFFQFYPRLAKSMKRGLYLVSVMLNGDRVLVTNDDVLPMVEVDENYGHNLLADFQWFIKLTFVWDDLKSLRADLERCSSATSFYLRIKLVQAAIELQTLEEMNNLGRLHHSYFRDHDGNVAFVLINDVSGEARASLSSSNLKWITLSRFLDTMRDGNSTRHNSSLQQIIDKLPEMIDFSHASMRRLDAGLYVSYLKIQNSVDSIRVMVNKHIPGSLPSVKIRSVANVSKEEWEWLHQCDQQTNSETNLELFQNQFRQATKDLFLMLNLPDSDYSSSRIYDSQVVEIRDDLSLIIVMPTADEVNHLSRPLNHSFNSFLYLPVYIFEVLQHLSNNYRFICQYSRVSICLDFELIYAQQSQREAFSLPELDQTRSRLNDLLSCQQDLDEIWRLARWLVHVINCAKDKSYTGISLKSFQSIGEVSPPIELTVYLPSIRDQRHLPLKLRLRPAMTLPEIFSVVRRDELCESSANEFVWIRGNEHEYSLEENLTARDLDRRLARFGGQIRLQHRSDPSLFEPSQ